MARIEATTHVEAPPQRVWDVLVDWGRQAEWMVDVRSLAVVSEERDGLGVTVRCRTNILGLTVNDELEVTEWEPPTTLGMRHLGPVIQGAGAFELTETPYGTRLVWWEEAHAPLGSVGDTVTGVVIVPWVNRVFRRSLARLKRLCENP